MNCSLLMLTSYPGSKFYPCKRARLFQPICLPVLFPAGGNCRQETGILAFWAALPVLGRRRTSQTGGEYLGARAQWRAPVHGPRWMGECLKKLWYCHTTGTRVQRNLSGHERPGTEAVYPLRRWSDSGPVPAGRLGIIFSAWRAWYCNGHLSWPATRQPCRTA